MLSRVALLLLVIGRANSFTHNLHGGVACGRGVLRRAVGDSSSSKERLESVRTLQRAFYSDEDGVVQEASGIIRDLPLWRVQWVELPGFQNVLNVWQPMYTHMFERVVAGPKPWLFGHLHLPGGSTNLGKPGFGLDWDTSPALQDEALAAAATDEGGGTGASPRGTQHAPVCGTLMQVSDLERLDDGRLKIVVQAVERFVVLGTSRLTPYSVASAVQLLPDDECVAQYKPAAAATLYKAAPLSSPPELLAAATATAQAAASDEAALALARAAAAAEGEAWRGFEFAPVSLPRSEADGGGPSAVSLLAPFNGGALGREAGAAKFSLSSSSLAACLVEGVHEVLGGEPLAAESGQDLVAKLVAKGVLFEVNPTPPASDSAREGGERKTGIATGDGSSALSSVAALEFEVWCAIDRTIRLLRELNPGQASSPVPLPTQLLQLLPRRPPAGRRWPLGFYFHEKVVAMSAGNSLVGTETMSEFVAVGGGEWQEQPGGGAGKEEGEGAREEAETEGFEDSGGGGVFVGAYPALRRARRLSFCASSLVDGLAGLTGGQTDPIGLAGARQQLLSITSTAGRLFVVLERFNVINGVLRSFVDSKDLLR